MGRFLKKAIIIIFSMTIFAIIVFCALYSLGFIYGTNVRQVTDKEYTAGDFSYTYTGPLKDGKPDGRGEITFSNGDRYVGGLKDWRFSKYGDFHSADGWRYEGVFSEGQALGGMLYGANGDVLTHKPGGLSEFVSAAGWNYTGTLDEWGQSGTGKFVFPDGAVYEGDFVWGQAEADHD